jgi:hypothetical protein
VYFSVFFFLHVFLTSYQRCLEYIGTFNMPRCKEFIWKVYSGMDCTFPVFISVKKCLCFSEVFRAVKGKFFTVCPVE